MWKLRNKGLSVIEVICSITIFCMITITTISLMLSSIRLKMYNKQLYECCTILEALRNNIIFNLDYRDLEKMASTEIYYIDKKDLKIENITSLNINSLLSIHKSDKTPYIAMRIENSNIIEITLQAHINALNKEDVIELKFYKGRFL